MIGLDTNVVVRYLVQDDPAQSKKASRLIEEAAGKGEILFLNAIVLCELAWVLAACYDLDKKGIAGILDRILSTRDFEVEDRDLAWQALKEYGNSPADFADCLIGRKNKAHGCAGTATFDPGLKKLDTFRIL